MAFFLQRDIKLYIEDEPTVHKLSIQSDFNYNRTGRANSVNRESMNPLGDRSVNPIIEEVGSINFSFSTYAELDDTGANVTSAQKLLWRGLLGSSNGISESETGFACTFGSFANLPSLEPLIIYIEHVGAEKTIKLSNVVIDSLEIDVSIDKLVNLRWRGTALNYEEGTAPAPDKDYSVLGECMITKYSTVALNRKSVDYNLALISGRIRIDNNNQYYTRRQFGRSQAIAGHYTGAREVTGNLEFYMKTGVDSSYDLYNTIMLDAGTDTTTNYAYELENTAFIQLKLGNASAEHIHIDMPEAVLNLPTQKFRSVMTVSVPFIVKESVTKEFYIRYSNVLRYRIDGIGNQRTTSFGDARVYID